MHISHQRMFLMMFVLLLIRVSTTAQTNASQLDLDEIMKGNDFIGHSPERPFWSLNGDTLYYYQKESEFSRSFLKAYIMATGEHKTLDISREIKVKNIPFMSDVKTKNPDVFMSNGQVILWDPETKNNKTLYLDDDIVQPLISNDGRSIFYRRGENWFRHHIADQQIIRLSDIRKENKPSKESSLSYIEKKEIELFEYIRHEQSQEKADSLYRSEREEYKRLKKVYTGKDNNVIPLGISIDGRYAFYALEKKSRSVRKTEIPNWVNQDAHVTTTQARPKVGEASPGQELLVVDLFSQSHFIQDFSTLRGIKDKPTYLKEYIQEGTSFDSKVSEPRDIRFRRYLSSKSGSKHVIECYAVDNKDRWIIEMLPASKSFKLIDRQRDEAWVLGPYISSMSAIGFIGKSDSLYFISESSGYAHLHIYDFFSSKTESLTSGNYEIHQVTLSKDKKKFYLKANREHPGIYHIYELRISDQKWNQLTFKPGNWDLFWNHDETQFAALSSESNKPPELYLVDDDGFFYAITKSTTSDFNDYDWRKPDVIRFKASDGQRVYARLYKPQAETKNNAAVIFVHGAGYLQNAHHFWSSYYREYMFHNFLVDQGYTVLDIDYRGSKGYGRDWRTGIYRHLGGLDLSDHIDGVQFLIDSLEIDSSRVGIYGGSYGGFITLMALFKHPGTFACGAALRSVTDWAHYNHGYTSNILNTPETDPAAFERSSPINFAENLADHLLILHGMVDDNVQLQDVVRLSQRLIELKKDNWNVMYYPVEKHGFRQHSSWLDEYRRIYKLFQEQLLD